MRLIHVRLNRSGKAYIETLNPEMIYFFTRYKNIYYSISKSGTYTISFLSDSYSQNEKDIYPVKYTINSLKLKIYFDRYILPGYYSLSGFGDVLYLSIQRVEKPRTKIIKYKLIADGDVSRNGDILDINVNSKRKNIIPLHNEIEELYRADKIRILIKKSVREYFIKEIRIRKIKVEPCGWDLCKKTLMLTNSFAVRLGKKKKVRREKDMVIIEFEKTDRKVFPRKKMITFLAPPGEYLIFYSEILNGIILKRIS